MGVLFNEAPSEATMAAVAPYFEAEAENGTGQTTQLKFQNASAVYGMLSDVEMMLS